MTEIELQEDREKAHYSARLSNYNIPARMYQGIIDYIVTGTPTGSFLAAIFQNDLVNAIGKADAENSALLREYALFLYNEAPMPCWGSDEEYHRWIDKGGLMKYKK